MVVVLSYKYCVGFEWEEVRGTESWVRKKAVVFVFVREDEIETSTHVPPGVR